MLELGNDPRIAAIGWLDLTVPASGDSTAVYALRHCGLTDHQLRALQADIETIATYGKETGDWKQCDRKFRGRYAGVLKHARFSEPEIRERLFQLSVHIGKNLDSKTARAARQASATDLPACLPVIYEEPQPAARPLTQYGLQAERTQAAFEAVRDASCQVLGIAAGATGSTEGIIEVAPAAPDKALSGAALKRWNRAQSEERERLRKLNPALQAWLESKGLVAVPNTGAGLNCLIHALLQHASGDYGNPQPAEAQRYRQMIGTSGMLHSDDRTMQTLVAKINEDFNVSMNVHVIQATENGLPVILPKIATTGEHNVVIWQKGAHYEAVVATARDSAEADTGDKHPAMG